MSLARTFVINMVGAFYNTFLPGSTGGDLLKAYYAAKQTTMHRTAPVMSVIIDRIIGLLALVMMGGTAATFQYLTSRQHDAATRKCGQVALGSAAILVATALALLLLYNKTLRQIRRPEFHPQETADADAGEQSDSTRWRSIAALAVGGVRDCDHPPSPRRGCGLRDVRGHGVRSADQLALLLGVPCR